MGERKEGERGRKRQGVSNRKGRTVVFGTWENGTEEQKDTIKKEGRISSEDSTFMTLANLFRINKHVVYACVATSFITP